MPRRKVPSAAQVRGWTITPASESDDHPELHADDGNTVDEPATDDPDALKFGYTMADLQRLARKVVSSSAQQLRAGDRWIQADDAFSGMAEHLYAATAAPTERDLFYAGAEAIAADAKSWRRQLGLLDTGSTGIPGERPRFATYWHQPPAEPWDEQIVERIALTQILPTLTAAQRQAVNALATLGGYAEATEALGLPSTTFANRLNSGRSQFRQMWFAPDTPTAWRRDSRPNRRSAERGTHCRNSHEFTPENTYWTVPEKPGRAPRRRCRACESDRAKQAWANQSAATRAAKEAAA